MLEFCAGYFDDEHTVSTDRVLLLKIADVHILRCVEIFLNYEVEMPIVLSRIDGIKGFVVFIEAGQ
jgi:hypothetical protein